jgi:hypothetical protein
MRSPAIARISAHIHADELLPGDSVTLCGST